MEPVATVATASAPDPVDYDSAAEAERLARVDRTRAAAEHRRDGRIEDEAGARREQIVHGLTGGILGPGGIGPGNRWPRGVHPACGRG